ncbi:hypothetical protein C0J52_28020 [Blattella germanica]|nr:hypothetical protein C0J52_28020 [Blattella germanica]
MPVKNSRHVALSNDQIFSEVDFAASEVYGRPIEGVADTAQPGPSSSSSEPTNYAVVPNGNGVLALPLAKKKEEIFTAVHGNNQQPSEARAGKEGQRDES